MSDRLFDVEGVPEVPLFREPRARKGAARGSSLDARFLNDYPPEWSKCPTCVGKGRAPGDLIPFGDPLPRAVRAGEEVELVCKLSEGVVMVSSETLRFNAVVGDSLGTYGLTWEHEFETPPVRRIGDGAGIRLYETCRDCLGMGSLKARVRLEAGHRCERCKHPYVPKGDAAKLFGIDPTPYHWSPCDTGCTHAGPTRLRKWMIGVDLALDPLHYVSAPTWQEFDGRTQREVLDATGYQTWDELLDVGLEAEWRILTVHHLDGDKANCAWWNLAALCQRCHLEIQAKVVMERVYPHEHSEWFKPHAAGYYAKVYLGEDLTREEADARQDELLALERIV